MEPIGRADRHHARTKRKLTIRVIYECITLSNQHWCAQLAQIESERLANSRKWKQRVGKNATYRSPEQLARDAEAQKRREKEVAAAAAIEIAEMAARASAAISRHRHA